EEAVLKAYFGVVVKLERDHSGSEHWPNSPWGCLHIKWDMDGSTNSLGPWEPRPVRGHASHAQHECAVVP
ncbi:unnamed protein product, partial [Hapterophycus canaliculatus]